MPFLIFLWVILIIFVSAGNVNETFKRSYHPVDPYKMKWDQSVNERTTEIYQQKVEFENQIAYYRSTLNHKLSEDLMRHLIKEANRNDVPVEILIKLLKMESNYNKDVVGPLTKYGHAYGMAQFMKNTAPWIARMANLEYKFEYLFDPYYSITLAATYLNYLQYGDGYSHEGYYNWHSSLTAYHRGMGGLRAYERRHHTTESWYSKAILEQAQEIALKDLKLVYSESTNKQSNE